MSNQGVNWADMDVLSKAGINGEETVKPDEQANVDNCFNLKNDLKLAEDAYLAEQLKEHQQISAWLSQQVRSHRKLVMCCRSIV